MPFPMAVVHLKNTPTARSLWGPASTAWLREEALIRAPFPAASVPPFLSSGFVSPSSLSGPSWRHPSYHTQKNAQQVHLPARSQAGDPFPCNYRVVPPCRCLHAELWQPTINQRNPAANVVRSQKNKETVKFTLSDRAAYK